MNIRQLYYSLIIIACTSHTALRTAALDFGQLVAQSPNLNAAFTTNVLQSSTPVVVKFFMKGCGPCNLMGPIFDKAADLLNGKVTLIGINLKLYPSVSSRYGIRSAPTFIYFKNGVEVNRHIGPNNKNTGQRWTPATLADNILSVFGL
ncbi:MAG: thioredoxin family protein [Candidatus Babeliaceae bacterium]|jgi:thioredoxin 1